MLHLTPEDDNGETIALDECQPRSAATLNRRASGKFEEVSP